LKKPFIKKGAGGWWSVGPEFKTHYHTHTKEDIDIDKLDNIKMIASVILVLSEMTCFQSVESVFLS
jgi:hypothetical protein